MRRFPDLPVSVELAGPLADDVTSFVEVEAGWQTVGAGTALAPVLVLADRPVPGVPTVVVTDRVPSAEERADALAAGALDVVDWPAGRQRLLEAPLRLAARRPTAPGPPVLRIGGAAGGAGTSTFALAAAALVAWSGGHALVVGGDDLLALAGMDPWQGAGSVELSALGSDAGAEVAGVATVVPSVPGLSVVGGGGTVTDTGGWPADVVVVDQGRRASPQPALLVARPDRSLATAPQAVPVVVNGAGAADRRECRRLLGREVTGWLPGSARVARAGVAGRVPSALPGSWVTALRRALRAAGV